MMQQVRLTRTYVRIGQRQVELQRLCLYPLPVLVVQSLLRNLADVDLRIEVGGEGMMVVASIAVDDIEILNLVEVMLGGVGRIDTADTRVEAAA